MNRSAWRSWVAALLLTLLTASGATALEGTAWYLVQFQSMDDSQGITKPDPGQTYRLEFLAGGRLSATLNCNRGSGSWESSYRPLDSSGSLVIGVVAATRALCAPPSMDEQLASQLSDMRGFIVRDGMLHLSLMADAGIYSWLPANAVAERFVAPRSADQGGPRVWRVEASSGLNMRSDASLTADVVARLPAGTWLDNLGCEFYPQRSWCYVQPFGGGPVGYVAAEYLQPATAPDGSVPRGADNSALRAGRREFDARGQLPCSVAVSMPTGACSFAVARAGSGDATLVIDMAPGQQRVIFFRMGKPMSVSGSEASGFPELSSERQGDLNLLRVGDERYEVPDAVIWGG